MTLTVFTFEIIYYTWKFDNLPQEVFLECYIVLENPRLPQISKWDVQVSLQILRSPTLELTIGMIFDHILVILWAKLNKGKGELRNFS